jgi:hypothetical protein
MSTVITENQNLLTNLYNITDASPHLGSPYFSNPTLRNFEPRVGFAWDPFRSGKTAVRGGFGLFDVLPLLYSTITLNGRGAPFFAIASTSNKPLIAGKFPSGALAAVQGGAQTLENAYVEHVPHRNYVMQWNLNIQREVVPNLTVVVGYVGSHGAHQPFRIDDANIVIPTLTPEGYLWPCGQDGKGNACAAGFLPTSTQASPVPSVPINPSVGAIRLVDWGGSSSYDALQIGIQKRMSHGFQVQTSYTWVRALTAIQDQLPAIRLPTPSRVYIGLT